MQASAGRTCHHLRYDDTSTHNNISTHNASSLKIALAAHATTAVAARRPNIVLVMADDMGWGQTGYYNHPILKTPNLNAMAAAGLRMDRFYAGAPVCSPTRASVLTGRTNDRLSKVA